MDRVFVKIGDQLGPVDLERPQHGGIRWLSRAHYHRYELIERGLIENRRRGVWSITDDGREYLQRQQANDAIQTSKSQEGTQHEDGTDIRVAGVEPTTG